jgi:uncharacterized protein YndB with AHSA1/START domain
MKKNDPPIIVEANYSTSIENVWAAITEPEKMQQCFFLNIETFKTEIGFETTFTVQSGEKTFTHLCKIKEAIPFKKLSYNWSYEEYSGDGYVVFEIFEKSGGT